MAPTPGCGVAPQWLVPPAVTTCKIPHPMTGLTTVVTFLSPPSLPQHPKSPSSHLYHSTSLPSSTTTSSSLSIKPSTATMSLYPSTSSSSHSVSGHTHRHVPVWTSPLDKQVPLRGFEVPAETLRDLKAEQRRSVQTAGDNVLNWQKERPVYGNYAFPESECSSESNEYLSKKKLIKPDCVLILASQSLALRYNTKLLW